MSIGTGTFTDPIIAMSGDPAQIRRDIRASLAHFDRRDDPYWVEKETTPAQFSNGLWHLGHNRYWESAMEPTDTGSRNPADGRVPAFYTVASAPPPPIVVPDPPLPDPPEPTASEEAAGLLALVLARLDNIDAQLTTLVTRPAVVPPTLPGFPTYSGSIFGIKVTLKPTP